MHFIIFIVNTFKYCGDLWRAEWYFKHFPFSAACWHLPRSPVTEHGCDIFSLFLSKCGCQAISLFKKWYINQNNRDQTCGLPRWLSGLHHACDLCHRRGSLGRPCATETGGARRGHRWTHGVKVANQAFDESYCQSISGSKDLMKFWGLDSCCCWWSWFGCYPIRKVRGSRDFRHCRGWGRFLTVYVYVFFDLAATHFDSLKGLCWQKSIVDCTWRVSSQIWLLERTYFQLLFELGVSGEACVLAWSGCEVHYQQPQWKQVWNRHEDLPGARRCWGSGCSFEQPQPRWLHLTFPFLLEEWWSIYWDWQKRHLDSPAWSWVGEDLMTGKMYNMIVYECIWLWLFVCVCCYVMCWVMYQVSEADVGSSQRCDVRKDCRRHHDGKGVLEVSDLVGSSGVWDAAMCNE